MGIDIKEGYNKSVKKRMLNLQSNFLVKTYGIYFQAIPKGLENIAQKSGIKIHVSLPKNNINNNEKLVTFAALSIIRYLSTKKVPFKIINSLENIIQNDKDDLEKGKHITIYVTNKDKAFEICSAIYQFYKYLKQKYKINLVKIPADIPFIPPGETEFMGVGVRYSSKFGGSEDPYKKNKILQEFGLWRFGFVWAKFYYLQILSRVFGELIEKGIKINTNIKE